MISRRAMLAGGALALADGGSLARTVEKSFLPAGLPEGVYDTASLEALPGKKPLIKLSYRPPNYETPLSYFTSEFRLMAKATNSLGQAQADKLVFNPAGYNNNVPRPLTITVV